MFLWWSRGRFVSMMACSARVVRSETESVLVSAVSPYEFHARAVGVYAALTLSDRVLTPLPTDGAGDTSTLRPEDLPRTLETAREWAWSAPLWRERVLTPAIGSSSPLEDIGAVCDEIEAVEAWSDIRPMVDARLFEEPRARLEAIARDLKHGGVNPGVSIPVSCGLARFAGRHGSLMFRSPATSTVTKLEAQSTTVRARCAAPVLEGVNAATIVAVRDTLASSLAGLRDAMTETVETIRTAGVTAEDLRGVEREVLMPASESYAREFADHRRVLCERAEDEGCRYRVRSLTLSFGAADPDGVLRAAAAAARSLRGPRSRGSRAGFSGVETGEGSLGQRALAVCGVGVRKLEPTLA
ncbi:MAG: hypothetical protein Tsb0013_01630 [Phycisphaerales bacterium]